MQKYPNIIKSFAYTLKIFVTIFLLLLKFLISCGIYLTPKLSKHVTLTSLTYKAIQ